LNQRFEISVSIAVLIPERDLNLAPVTSRQQGVRAFQLRARAS